MDAKTTPYLQFPLCALAFGSNEEERLNHIVWYAALYAGRKLWAKLCDGDRMTKVNRWKASPLSPSRKFDISKEDHRTLRFGCERIGLECKNFQNGVECHDALVTFLDDYEFRQGRDCQVRIRADLILEAMGKSGIRMDEFVVLMAVRSAIGDSRFKQIGRETIRCRALGYKSKASMSEELPFRKDGAKPLSDWILRSRLEALHVRKFFARCTYGRRITYYSTKLKDQALRDAVFEHATRRQSSYWIHRTENQDLTDAIRNHRATLAGKPLPAPNATGLPVARTVDPVELI